MQPLALVAVAARTRRRIDARRIAHAHADAAERSRKRSHASPRRVRIGLGAAALAGAIADGWRLRRALALGARGAAGVALRGGAGHVSASASRAASIIAPLSRSGFGSSVTGS